jgi:hypothetical protein
MEKRTTEITPTGHGGTSNSTVVAEATCTSDEVGEVERGHDMIESPPSPVYLLRPDIEDYFAPANSNKLREPNRLGGGGGGSGGHRGQRICLRWSKSRSSWAADLLAGDFPAVGTMRADKTSAGAVVDVQHHNPSDAAGGQSWRRRRWLLRPRVGNELPAVLRRLIRYTTLGSNHV